MITYPGFDDVELIEEPTYKALLIQSIEQGVAIGGAIQAAKMAGTISSGLTHMTDYPDGSSGWVVQITIGIGTDAVLYTGYEYDWLVLDSDHNLRIFHGGSPAEWKGINPEFTDKYVVPPIDWAATSAAPTANPGDTGTATITFPQPALINAPFTYTVEQTDTTDGSTTGPAELDGDPVVDDDGLVTLTVTGLTDHGYTFVVDVATPYAGITAASLPTAAITGTP